MGILLKKLKRKITKILAYRPLVELRLKRKRRAAKRKIFIDCGSNTCRILRIQIEKRPGFEFYAFEAQPGLAKEGKKVVSEYPHKSIHFFNKAVWIDDSKLNFFLATEWGNNYKGGSTILSGHAKKAMIDYSKPFEVECIDFSKWILDNFADTDDYVVVKMDIEGAEYEILEKMIKDGSIRYIDELFVEYHWMMNETISRKRHDALLDKLKKEKTKVVEWI